MPARMSVKDALVKVIYALHKAGFSRDNTLDILNSVYHGTPAWNELDMAGHVFRVYEAKPKEEK